jgi:hypothetical protein
MTAWGSAKETMAAMTKVPAPPAPTTYKKIVSGVSSSHTYERQFTMDGGRQRALSIGTMTVTPKYVVERDLTDDRQIAVTALPSVSVASNRQHVRVPGGVTNQLGPYHPPTNPAQAVVEPRVLVPTGTELQQDSNGHHHPNLGRYAP